VFERLEYDKKEDLKVLIVAITEAFGGDETIKQTYCYDGMRGKERRL
jgi:hypothetical protein